MATATRCASCGGAAPAAARLCEACAGEGAARCAACGARHRAGARFCDSCGARLPAAATSGGGQSAPPGAGETAAGATAAAGAAAPGDERKIVTAVFADLKESTALMEHLDPEEARAIVDPALQIMIDAVHRYGGYVVQSTGDGIFALFGAPLAEEDHPQRALYGALRMQQRLRELAERQRAARRPALAARVGVHTGEVVLRAIRTGAAHTEYTPIGHTANLAARIQALAAPGAVAASAATAHLVEGQFRMRPLGRARVKGVSEAVEIFEVAAAEPLRTRLEAAAGRGLSPFVGRQRELAQMVQALERARGGAGRVRAIVGEAGVGKSRLIHEFEAVAAVRGCTVLRTFAPGHARVAGYTTAVALARQYFGVAPGDPAPLRREKVAARIGALDRALADAVPYMCAFLGAAESALAEMDAELRRRRTMEAATRILLRESAERPLLIIVEDLHWIDADSEAFLHALAAAIAAARVLLLVSYRPGYGHRFVGRADFDELRLEPLGTAMAGEMLDTLLGGVREAEAIKRFVIERAGGNPLFIEELVRTLVEEGVLRSGDGAPAAPALARLRIPPTVQGILAARIDRLAPEAKELLQVLAVIGAEFAASLVEAVARKPVQELERLLARLCEAEFICQRGGGSEAGYRFKHPLIQEVAYNSVLRERRKALHQRVGCAIEEQLGAGGEERCAELADHFSRAANASKAVRYLALAAEQGARGASYTEAAADYRRALEMLAGVNDAAERTRSEIDLQLGLARALTVLQTPASVEVERAYERARELCRSAADDQSLFTALEGLRLCHRWRRRDPAAAHGFATEMLRLAERVGEPRMLARAEEAMGSQLLAAGSFARARAYLERGLGRTSAPGEGADAAFGTARIILANLLAEDLWLLGYPERAQRTSALATAFARESSNPMLLTIALAEASHLAWFLRDPAGARQKAEAAIELCAAHSFGRAAGLLGIATAVRGWAIATADEPARGLAEVQHALGLRDQAQARTLSARESALLAEAYLLNGRRDDARRTLVAARTTVAQSAMREYEAEVNRLLGELAAADAEHDASEAHLRAALEVARAQEAKSWELRAAVSLARLMRAQGRSAEAHAALAPVYRWFNEGFEAADLRAARALLDELGG